MVVVVVVGGGGVPVVTFSFITITIYILFVRTLNYVIRRRSVRERQR